jgi:hypothetical protein
MKKMMKEKKKMSADELEAILLTHSCTLSLLACAE